MLLCRGLTRAIYMLCIEHLRMLRLSGESNRGPPALQAHTLCKEPLERRIKLPFGISACAATAPPPKSWLNVIRLRVAFAWRSIQYRCVRNAHHVGITTL
jgi:hypothetical protein